jgi:4-amino-4-deoxy-L-arabinose transferase-like glycosyltransferase
MAWLLIEILLVAWVPGALLLRLPGQSRAYRATLPADERLFWTVLLSVVWSTTVAVLLGGFDRYAFDRLMAINSVIALLVVVTARHHLMLPRPVTRLSAAALAPAAIAALGLWLYFPPSEYIIGGKDPGTYINEGVQIAQRGQTVIRDGVVAGVPVPFRDLFFPAHGQSTYYGLRFMGFFIQDAEAGTVVGQFPHFYPASVAIGYGLNGLSGARQAIGVWALLGLLAVYFTGARLFGRVAAGAAVALLAINVVMVWFARYPNSELPMQALLFAALLAAGRARSGGGRFFAASAGALLGLALFLRYEVLLAMAAFAGAAVLAPISRQRLGPAFVAALIVTGAAGSAYLIDTMRAYVALPIGFVSTRGGWPLVAAGTIAAFVLHRVLRIDRIGTQVRRWAPIVIATVLGGLAIYAYFFRDAGGRTALGDAMALRTFGWYLTPWGLLLASAGAVWFVARDLWRDPTFYLTFVTFSTFFFYKTRIVPEHFWTSRRFLGVALPGAMLLMAAVVREAVKPERLARLGARRTATATPDAAPPSQPRWAGLLSVALVVAFLAPVALAFRRESLPVSRHVEYAGIIPQLELLASRVGDRDLLLVEGRNAGTDLHVMAMPLAYIYARNVLVLESPVPGKRTFEQFVAWAHTRYDRVLFLGGGGTDLLTRTTRATPLAATRFQVPEYDSPINAYPRTIHAKEFEFGLYQLTTGTPLAPGPVDLQIGGADDLNVVRFHARERNEAEGLVYRWTGAQSFILLPSLHPEARELTLWMSHGGRPAGVDPAIVEVAIDDEAIGSAVATDTVRPHSFALPPDLVARLSTRQDPVRLRLRAPTWSPAVVLGAPDTRNLGVMVTRVQVQ